jgi:hypothetical protein
VVFGPIFVGGGWGEGSSEEHSHPSAELGTRDWLCHQGKVKNGAEPWSSIRFLLVAAGARCSEEHSQDWLCHIKPKAAASLPTRRDKFRPPLQHQKSRQDAGGTKGGETRRCPSATLRTSRTRPGAALHDQVQSAGRMPAVQRRDHKTKPARTAPRESGERGKECVERGSRIVTGRG